MTKKKIDLSEIKENDIEKTATFRDLMSRKERKKTIDKNDDIEEMINEKRKKNTELKQELIQAQKEYKEKIKEEEIEENITKTQILELTRQMKFNFEENKENNIQKKKRGLSPLNIVGILNLICIGCYIYLLAFTNYQDTAFIYILNGCIIVFLVLVFGLSVVTTKKISKFFYILNILVIIFFIIFNIYTLLN